MDYFYKIKSMLFGIAIGDALGVPFEFKSRESLIENPVKDMVGYGVHNKPPGTFSDDSSLTFSLVESLIDGYDLDDIALNIVKWYDEAFWSADGEVFSVGRTTRSSIYNLKNGVDPTLSGGSHEFSNGNGSLMKIAPLVFILIFKPIAERFQIIDEVSAITHGHIRTVIACFYFLEFLRHLLLGNYDKHEIYHKLQEEIPDFLFTYFKDIYSHDKKDLELNLEEISFFNRLLKENIYELDKSKIKSGGYVIDTLEAGIWCLLTTNNYHDAVLQAVNLGGDTDTTASVCGALASVLYGFDEIPNKWVEKLLRSEEIEDLAIRFSESLK